VRDAEAFVHALVLIHAQDKLEAEAAIANANAHNIA
jgi:hypothetical protein